MVIVAFGFVMVGFLVANSVGASFTTVFPSPHISTQGTISYTASTVLQSIMSMAVAIGSARYACLLSLLDIHWSRLSNPRRRMRDIGWTIQGFVILFAVSQAISIALLRFGFVSGTNRSETAARAHPMLALSFIMLSFIPTGSGGEILFRGGVRGILRQTFSSVSAVFYRARFSD